MAEMTFGCPHCSQTISCDEAWAGQQIQCPICQGAIIAPAPAAGPAGGGKSAHNPLVPKPPPGGGRLALNTNAQQPAQTGREVPVRNLAPPPPPKRNFLKPILITVAILAILGGGGYFGYNWYTERQAKANADSGDATKQKAAGDGTEGGSRRSRKASASAAEQAGTPAPAAADATTDANAAAAVPTKVVPPVWTLSLPEAKIPGSKVNGTISGTNFVAETVRIDPIGKAQTLRLIQGQLVSPDGEMLVYLHLKPGEKLGGQSLKISSDMKGPGVPTVTKRWKTNPRFAPQSKSFSSGYALTLDLGPLTNGMVAGKIYLALPDPEQTVVAGSFNALTPQAVTDPNQAMMQPAAVPVAPAPGTGMTPSERAAFQKRYGTGAR